MTTRPAPSRYSTYAASSAETYERHFVPAIGEPVARHLVQAARPAPGERVLDIACGTGIASRLALQAVGSGATSDRERRCSSMPCSPSTTPTRPRR